MRKITTKQAKEAARIYARAASFTGDVNTVAANGFYDGVVWAQEILEEENKGQAKASSQFTFVLKYHKLGYPSLITRELQNLGADSLESAVRAAQAMCGDGEGFILKPM